MLGQRYGYVPQAVRLKTLQRYDWTPEYPDHSITALEIIHGVLLNPPMHGQSFSYFRDPAFMADVADAIREAVLEPEDEQVHEKQEALKECIRLSDIPYMEDYPCEYAGRRIEWRLVQASLDEGQCEQRGGLAAAIQSSLREAACRLRGAGRAVLVQERALPPTSFSPCPGSTAHHQDWVKVGASGRCQAERAGTLTTPRRSMARTSSG